MSRLPANISCLRSRVRDRLDLPATITTFAVAIIAINACVSARIGHVDRAKAIASTNRDNSNLAIAYARYVVRTIEAADAATRVLKSEVRTRGRNVDLVRLFTERALDPKAVAGASIIDENGAVAASSHQAETGEAWKAARATDLSFHAANDNDTAHVGVPVPAAASAARWVPISRRLEHPNGSFAGVAVAYVDSTRFTEFYHAVPRRADDSISLIGLDGRLRASLTGDTHSAAERVVQLPAGFEEGKSPVGDFVATSNADGVRRLISYRRLEDYPLIVGIGVSEKDAVAEAVKRTNLLYVRSAILTALIATFAFLLVRAVSRRKRAMESLAQSEGGLRAREEELRTLTESMPQLVWIADADGAHSFFNQQWIEYTGLSHEQSVGEGWTAAFDPAEQPEALGRWRATVAKGEVYEAEYRLRRADGAYRWMLARAVPLRDDAGRITKWFGTSTDINNQVVAQAQLREAQEVARIGSWSRDPHTGTHTWSDELYHIFGLTPGDFVPSYDSIGEMIHPDDRAQFLRDRVLPIATMAPFCRDVRIVRKDGRVRTVQHNVAVETDRSGLGLRVHGTVQDVTGIRATEQQLREQANLLNLTRDAIIVREADDTISFWNNGAERIYGWTAEEVLGNRAQDFAYAGSASAANARRHLAEHGEWRGEVEHLRKDGSTVTVNSRWTLVRSEPQAASSVLVVNTDITEHKKLQDQLLRTQRLESIGTLASGVAHDLNNILAPIMMAAPLLRQEMPAAKRGQLVSLLEQSAERGAAIVRQVLTFARGADGERVLVQPSYSLREIAEIATETFPRSITITADYPEDLALIEADPTQIHQVLLNLCVNARDAMPDGGVLSLSGENFYVDEHYAAMTPGLQAGPHLLITVSDTGTGIPPHILGKIFDPFFTTKGVGTGTGLGLSTVLGIVRDYGGTVSAESSPRGTTFRILLPASFASSGEVDARAAEELPRGRGETILVVDDEEAIRAVAEPLLRASGYEVLLAADGPAALAIFAAQAQEIDIVLTDLAMPVMSGIALARTFRKMQPDACIIVSAGREDDCSPAELEEIGVVATLPKPYTQSALLRLLDQVISQHRKNL